MSTATIIRPVHPRSRRPLRQADQSRGPLARPVRALPAPAARSASRTPVRGCRVGPDAAAAAWRLTDRGIAVVLVLAAMIMVAAVAVVGLTAWRVTGPDYQTGTVASVTAR